MVSISVLVHPYDRIADNLTVHQDNHNTWSVICLGESIQVADITGFKSYRDQVAVEPFSWVHCHPNSPVSYV